MMFFNDLYRLVLTPLHSLQMHIRRVRARLQRAIEHAPTRAHAPAAECSGRAGNVRGRSRRWRGLSDCAAWFQRQRTSSCWRQLVKQPQQLTRTPPRRSRRPRPRRSATARSSRPRATRATRTRAPSRAPPASGDAPSPLFRGSGITMVRVLRRSSNTRTRS